MLLERDVAEAERGLRLHRNITSRIEPGRPPVQLRLFSLVRRDER
jgi:hypothetical protein